VYATMVPGGAAMPTADPDGLGMPKPP
jgi:hypothetical protein